MEGLIGVWEEFVNIVTYGNALDKTILSKVKLSFTQDKVILSVEDTFTKEWIEKNYFSKIKSMYENYGISTEVKVESKRTDIQNDKTHSETVESERTPKKVPKKIDKVYSKISKEIEKVGKTLEVIENNRTLEKFSLNPKFTFDNFVVGPCNDLAFYSAKNVAKEPGGNFNPLFIYGGVGLGKTHLIQAIAHEIINKTKIRKVVYVTSEQFTNDFFEAVNKKNLNSFRIKYREADVLLLDDVQFFRSSMKQTIEELFHMFNKLFNDKKQMVFTSDRSPKELTELTDRIRSRFGSGLIVEIKQPDFETRMKIIEKKLEDEDISLTEEIKLAIAQNVKNSIRDIEAALVKVIAYVSFKRRIPSSEEIETLLKDVIYEGSNVSEANATHSTKQEAEKVIEYDVGEIIEAVAKYYSISPSDLYGDSRKENLLLPRQIAIFLIKKLTSLSFTSIGDKLGKSHTTVMRSIIRVESLLKKDTVLKEQIKEIISIIKSNSI